MYKIIADSGSTKTDWRLISSDEVIASFQTEGLNPYFKSIEDVLEVLKADVLPNINDVTLISSIYFYGAGCSSIEKSKIIENAFRLLFVSSKVIVEHDLLGAAIALCGDKKGIAVILGTGSNSCLFDGRNIVKEQKSLGYILGDEGAGSNIGKQLITDFLYQNMPVHISVQLQDKFDLSKDLILDKIYKEPLANRYSVGESGNFIYVRIQIEALKQVIEWTPKAIQKYCKNISAEAVKALKALGCSCLAPNVHH